MFSLISYGIATVFLALALVLWRRSANLHNDVGRMHEVRGAMVEREKKLMVELSQLRSKLDSNRSELEKSRKTSAAAELNAEKLMDQIATLTKDLKLAKAATERETENLSEQLAAMTRQLAESQKVESIATKRFDEIKSKFDNELSEKTGDLLKEKAQLVMKLKAADEELQRKETEIQRRNELIKKISPRKVAALKRKLSNMNHLLITMRGAKELAEEQNANWQLALKEFSVWILKHKGQAPIEAETGVAKLVGAAICAIDVSLEPDEPTGSYHEPENIDSQSL